MFNRNTPLRLPGLLRRVGVLSAVLLIGGALVGDARADFTSPYAFTDFTLTNSVFANGVAENAEASRAIVLTGPNDGSGLSGWTELSITARTAGTLHFNYSYQSLDMPGFDTAGYKLNGRFFPLATANGQSGSVDVAIRIGDVFGFRVESADNTGEPGILVISNFVPPGPQPIPTTSFAAEAALAIFLCLLSLRVMRGASRQSVS